MSSTPEISSEYASDYKKVFVAGIFGGTRAFGVEAVLYSETTDVTKVLQTQPLNPNRAVVKRIAECELVMDPLQMKSTYQWLGNKIKEYERLFGPIPSPEELDSKLRHRKDPNQ